MSQNKVKSVTIEDESSSPVNSDVETINKNNQSSFDTNFGRLSIEILKFLCHKLGISDVGTKQDLVNRLGNEAKKRNGLSGLENSGKGKAVESDGDPKLSFDNQFKANVDAGQAFANVFGTPPSDNGNPFAKIGDDFPPRMSSSGEMPFSWKFQESVWKKRELTKARNQWEYNEWCKAGLLLDKALLSRQVEYVQLARQVALERAYMVRVADEDGWGVAAKMALDDSTDPMLELFSGKRERARMAAQLFPKNKRSKVSSSLYGQQDRAQTQTSNTCFPMFVLLQPFFPPSWQQMPIQNFLYATPIMGNKWNEVGPQDVFGPCSGSQAAHNFAPQNSWDSMRKC